MKLLKQAALAISLAYVRARRGAAVLKAVLFRISIERRRRKDGPLPKDEAVPG